MLLAIVVDQHFTSPKLAALMIEAVPVDHIAHVFADFAAGDGSLLTAAADRWPKALVVANDMSPSHGRRLAKSFPHGIVSCSDFMAPRSVSRASYENVRGGVDLLLLNPPFSQRGIPPSICTVGQQSVRAGVALAFLCRAVDFLSPDGLLLAILPDGCLSSDRDRAAWQVLHSRFRVELVHDNDSSAFSGVRAKTSLVRLSPLRRTIAAIRPVKERTTLAPMLVRGQCQMHNPAIDLVGGIGAPLVHTTDLRRGQVQLSGRSVAGQHTVRGPAVLFPRVGRVTPDKVAILDGGLDVTLSDCVIAVPCGTLSNARALRQQILIAWSEFAAAYRGTGAPYITVRAAAALLSRIFPLLCVVAEQHGPRAVEQGMQYTAVRFASEVADQTLAVVA